MSRGGNHSRQGQLKSVLVYPKEENCLQAQEKLQMVKVFWGHDFYHYEKKD